MKGLYKELRRRNVFRVGAAYAVVGWLLAEIGSLLFGTFEAPAWVMKVFATLIILGFPLALFFAWAFEMTPDGLKREKDIDRSQSAAPQSGRKFDFVIIFLLAVGLVYFVYESRLRDNPATEPLLTQPDSAMNASADRQRLSAKSIAVLPFVNLSGVQENEYFSDGLAETLLHMLAQIEELQVAARTSEKLLFSCWPLAWFISFMSRGCEIIPRPNHC